MRKRKRNKIWNKNPDKKGFLPNFLFLLRFLMAIQFKRE